VTDALYLSGDELEALATVPELIDAVREGYRQRGEGAPAKPRTTLTNDDPGGMLTGYLAVLPETGAMGGYAYSAGFGASDAWFFTPIFDADSGESLAVLDGAWMNPLKTGAAGAVGLDALAREDVTDLAVIGSGTQARGQLRAAVAVRAFDTVRVYSPTPDHREAFAREFDRAFDATVTAVESSTAAVEGADAVITATRASEPVFDGDDLDPGTHVTTMGQYHPEKRELDADTVGRATYVPDLRERAFQDAGSFLAALEAGRVGAGAPPGGGARAPGGGGPAESPALARGGVGPLALRWNHRAYRSTRNGGPRGLARQPSIQVWIISDTNIKTHIVYQKLIQCERRYSNWKLRSRTAKSQPRSSTRSNVGREMNREAAERSAEEPMMTRS
jgi:alanine dehydrogenase